MMKLPLIFRIQDQELNAKAQSCNDAKRYIQDVLNILNNSLAP